MQFVVQAFIKTGRMEYPTYTFKCKNSTHMHYLLKYVYKICYNKIEAITIQKGDNIREVRSNFDKIHF